MSTVKVITILRYNYAIFLQKEIFEAPSKSILHTRGLKTTVVHPHTE